MGEAAGDLPGSVAALGRAMDVQSHGRAGADEQCGRTGAETSGDLAQKLLRHAKCAGQSVCRADAERARDLCPTRTQSVRITHGCGARRLGWAACPFPFLHSLNGYRDFLYALKTGATPMGECHDNIKSLAMVFGAIESAATGRRIKVEV